METGAEAAGLAGRVGLAGRGERCVSDWGWRVGAKTAGENSGREGKLADRVRVRLSVA